MSTEAKIAGLREYFVEASAETFDDYLRYAESPIERLMIAQALSEGWIGPCQSIWSPAYDAAKEYGITTGPSLSNSGFYVMFIQPTVPFPNGESIRPDFLFIRIYGPNVPQFVVVELDGHDFHERTKEQARRDKSRDRVLSSRGWTVLRFTGSEVYADPAKVLSDIDNVLSGSPVSR